MNKHISIVVHKVHVICNLLYNRLWNGNHIDINTYYYTHLFRIIIEHLKYE